MNEIELKRKDLTEDICIASTDYGDISSRDIAEATLEGYEVGVEMARKEFLDKIEQIDSILDDTSKNRIHEYDCLDGISKIIDELKASLSPQRETQDNPSQVCEFSRDCKIPKHNPNEDTTNNTQIEVEKRCPDKLLGEFKGSPSPNYSQSKPVMVDDGLPRAHKEASSNSIDEGATLPNGSGPSSKKLEIWGTVNDCDYGDDEVKA